MNDFQTLGTPVYICETARLEHNLKILDDIQHQSGMKILLALKGFAFYESFGLIGRYLHGTSASSYNEVRLASEKFGKEIHTYLPAFKNSEMDEIARMSDILIFNSLSQWHRFYPEVKEKASCGLRINLELPFELPAYCNPNLAQSRLGIVADTLNTLPEGVEGLHIHALCSQNSDAFEQMISKLEKQYSHFLKQIKWLNFGGGHAVTREDYDRRRLVRTVQDFHAAYPRLTLYMEPSEAIAHNSGVLMATVLDIVRNDIDIAILDISVETHMIDVLVTGISPGIRQSAGSGRYHYQLAGISCAAGDIVGTYAFETPLNIGDKVIFEDQMSYSMVKSSSFNGINPASIAMTDHDGNLLSLKQFGYEDYLRRL